MTEADVATILSSGVSLIGLWFIICVLYKDFLTDACRSQLFALRDELFDVTWEEAVGFERSAYKGLRRSINGFIREMPGFGFLWVLLSLSKTAKKDIRALGFEEYLARRERDLNTLGVEIRAKISNLEKRLHWLMVAYLLLRSPVMLVVVLLPLLVVIVGLLVAILMGGQVIDILRKPFRALDAAAFARSTH